MYALNSITPHAPRQLPDNADISDPAGKPEISRHYLSENVENLVTTAKVYLLTGNALSNRITSGAYDDRIDGGLGAETMTGGARSP